MKKLISLIVSLAMMITAASAMADVSGSVSLNGSASMEKVVGVLSEQFMADHPGVTVTYDATGSGTGISAAQQGTADIGLASRGLKEAETGLVACTVALDSIAVIVNAGCGVVSLARDTIASDDVVDELFVQVKSDLIAAIAQDAADGAAWLDMLMVAKYLERIGDHATNVAEWAEYAITGKRSKNGKIE